MTEKVMIICKCGAYVDYDRLKEHMEVSKCYETLNYSRNISLENLFNNRCNKLETHIESLRHRVDYLIEHFEKLFLEHEEEEEEEDDDDALDINMLH